MFTYFHGVGTDRCKASARCGYDCKTWQTYSQPKIFTTYGNSTFSLLVMTPFVVWPLHPAKTCIFFWDEESLKNSSLTSRGHVMLPCIANLSMIPRFTGIHLIGSPLESTVSSCPFFHWTPVFLQLLPKDFFLTNSAALCVSFLRGSLEMCTCTFAVYLYLSAFSVCWEKKNWMLWCCIEPLPTPHSRVWFRPVSNSSDRKFDCVHNILKWPI